jgi:hypothetical protein
MLTDLPTVKRYLSLATTASDLKLGLLIPDQTQQFLDETGRSSFDLQTYTEVRDGLGVDTMQLMNWPVQSITSLTKNGCAILPSPAWNARGYVLDTPLGKITLICDTFSCGPAISFDRKNVTVVYVAGYPTITVTNELQVIPATPPVTQQNPSATWPAALTIYVAQPNWQADGGVSYFGGAALTPVTGPPGIGQYYVMGSGGYLFNIGDVGKQVTISYVAAGYPSDVVGAVTRMVALRYYQQGHEDKKQDKQGDGTTTYSKEAYPADVMRVIKKYKRYFSLPGF